MFLDEKLVIYDDQTVDASADISDVIDLEGAGINPQSGEQMRLICMVKTAGSGAQTINWAVETAPDGDAAALAGTGMSSATSRYTSGTISCTNHTAGLRVIDIELPRADYRYIRINPTVSATPTTAPVVSAFIARHDEDYDDFPAGVTDFLSTNRSAVVP